MTTSTPSPSEAPPSRLAEPDLELGPTLDLLEHASGADGEAWALMMRLFFTYVQPRYAVIAQEFGLHPAQAMVLQLLSEPRPMGALAAAKHCDSSNITGIVDRLEERRLVERRADESDRRVKLIALTAEGQRLRAELNRQLAEPPKAVSDLSQSDRRALREILGRALESTAKTA